MYMQRVTRLVVMGSLLAPCLVGNAVEALFGDAPAEGRVPASTERGKHVARVRSVKFNSAVLPSARSRPGDRVRLNLFQDVEVSGSLSRMRNYGTRGMVWSGRLDKDGGEFKLARSGKAVVGLVRSKATGKIYEIRAGRRGGQEIVEVDPSAYAVSHDVYAPDLGAKRAPIRGARAGGGNELDLLVVYTPAAKADAGGAAAISATIILAVDVANEALANSGLQYRIRLVHAAEVAYTESTSSKANLDRLTADDDGIMDDVHSLRDTYGADVVSLFVNVPEFGGRAWIIPMLHAGYAAYAFNVVQWDLAAGNCTLIHETGHNLGCVHAVGDVDGSITNAQGDGMYNYSHGWRFTGSGGEQYRTVMAYQPGQRIAHFSNPNINYDGVATGVALGQPNEAYCALSISNAITTAMAYRATVVPADTVDLMVASSSANTSLVEPGASVTLQGVVTNGGTAASGTISCDWYLSTDATVTTSDTRWQQVAVGDVAAGGTASTSETAIWPISGTFATPGTYYAALLADSEAEVSELNEDNNAGSVKTFSVTAPAPFVLTVPHADMLGYWSFDGGSGTDRSGKGNTLSLTGRVSVTWQGLSGDAIKLK